MQRMNLKPYINSLDPEGRATLAGKCDTSVGHLNNVMYGYKPCGPELAVLLERATAGAVTCEEMRPDVRWHRVRDRKWPNPAGRPLIDVSAAAPTAQPTEAAQRVEAA